jgi:hypothetical protein
LKQFQTHYILLEEKMDAIKAFFNFVLFLLAIFLVIWLVSSLTGTASVATIQPEQVPTVPAEGVKMFMHILGF